MTFYAQRTMFGEAQIGSRSDVAERRGVAQPPAVAASVAAHRLRSAQRALPDVRPQTLRVHAIDLGARLQPRPFAHAADDVLRSARARSSLKLDDGMAYVVVAAMCTLVRMIGRTWNARVAVKRDVHLPRRLRRAGPAPTRSQSSIGGGLRPAHVDATSVGVSDGTVGVVRQRQQQLLELDRRRRMAAGGRAARVTRRAVFCYGHRFDEGVILAPGLTYQQLRQGPPRRDDVALPRDAVMRLTS